MCYKRILRDRELMHDFDPDKYIESYCRRMNCRACEGTDLNGEPNGYGCHGLEKRQETMYQSILKRRRSSHEKKTKKESD